MATRPEDRWLSVREVQELCGGIGRATVYAWVKEERLPEPYKIGGAGSRTSRWSEREVREALRSNTKGGSF